MEAFGLVANILSLIEFSFDVFDRVQEYGTETLDVPEALEHIQVRLPVLRNVLITVQEGIKDGSIDERSRSALWPLMRRCEKEIAQLNKIIDQCLPKPGASRAKRTGKALMSFRFDGRIDKIDGHIERYISALTLQLSTAKSVPLGSRCLDLTVHE